MPAYDYKSSQNKAGQPSKKNYTQREWKLNSDILQKALIKHSLQKRSSLEDYTSNNTRQHDTTRVQHNTTRVQHEFNTA